MILFIQIRIILLNFLKEKEREGKRERDKETLKKQYKLY